MCALTGVSRASYYRAWRRLAPRREETELRDVLQRLAVGHRHYGYRRLTELLHRDGGAVNHKRVLRLMRTDNLLCLRRPAFVPATTDSRHDWRVVPNVARGMQVTGLDQLWVADITYVRLLEEFAFLAVILDAFSRRVVGWALDRHLRAALAVAALLMALAARRPSPGQLIHHSDRGVQGGFNWSSQQLEEEELRWPQGGSAALIGRCVRRCARQGAHRWPGASIDSGSGTRSRAGCRAKKRPSRLAPRLPWGHAGSVKLVACQRSVKRHCRSAICLSGSARRSRFFMQQAAEFARSLAS
jgi:transposase InsO family protein